MGTIQAGTYDVEVDATFLGKSAKKGTGYVAVRFKDEVGDTITAYLYTSDKAIERTIETLGVLGWDLNANNGDLYTLHETQLLVGAKAEIVVEDEEYNSKIYPKVRWINEPGGGGRSEGMAPDEAKAFAAALRAKVYGAVAGKGQVAKAAGKPAAKPASRPAPAKASVPPSGPEGDDEIPF